MRRFARLYAELDAQTATNAKVAALRRYFADAPAADAAWAVYFLAGGKPRQAVPTRLLREIAQRAAGLPDWLFEESYQAVGDLAETIAHVLPEGDANDHSGLAEWVEKRLAPLRGLAEAEIEIRLVSYWNLLDWQGRFLLTKLIGGGFRVGVSKLLVIRALAEHAGLDPKLVALRAMGYTDAKSSPTKERFARLIEPGDGGALEAGAPYPFFLAHQLADVASLGDTTRWQVEWKYDGIRAQVVRRAGQTWIWSRGEELVTERFPEIVTAAQGLPDGSVLDGEILAWKDGDRPAPFALLQQRIGRKTLGKKILSDAPVAFMAYDLLEAGGRDMRAEPQRRRRELLEALVAAQAAPGLLLSPLVMADDWSAYAALRAESRGRGVEGLMLKHVDSAYGTGRTRDTGTWWKWKIDPLSVDCVLIYAQAGHGRRASLYTDYTFAVWNGSGPGRSLVPFAKAYSGLTDEEFRMVDAVIRKTTIEKFGPVRSVTPSLVFELGFEGIQKSPRHKSGIAVRFPRMLRLRTDKKVEEADTLEHLQGLLAMDGESRDVRATPADHPGCNPS
jgi:DNA ligase-1